MKEFAFVFSVALLGLENFSDNPLLRFLPLLILLLLVCRNLLRDSKSFSRFKIPVIFILLQIIILVGVLRDNNPNSTFSFVFFKYLIFSLIIIAFVQTFNRYQINSSRIRVFFLNTIYIPLFVLVLLNLIGHFLGLSPHSSVEDAEIGEALLLSKLGMHINRVNFPFTPGFNSYASIVGLFFMASLISYKEFKKKRLLVLSGIVISIITLLLSDMRSAMIYPILIFLSFSFFRTKIAQSRLIYLLPLITIFGSAALLFILSQIANIPEFAFLARGSEDFETGNARNIIWGYASIEFLDFKPIHLIGYGDYGHYASGMSKMWAFVFGGSRGDFAELTTPHSVFYSVLFDYGYLGLAVIVYLQVSALKIIKKFYTKSKFITSMSLGFIIYWNLLGVTETFFGFYTPNILIMFVLFILLVYMIRYIDKKPTFIRAV